MLSNFTLSSSIGEQERIDSHAVRMISAGEPEDSSLQIDSRFSSIKKRTRSCHEALQQSCSKEFESLDHARLSALIVGLWPVGRLYLMSVRSKAGNIQERTILTESSAHEAMAESYRASMAIIKVAKTRTKSYS